MANPWVDKDIVTVENNPVSKANFYMITGATLIYVGWKIWLK